MRSNNNSAIDEAVKTLHKRSGPATDTALATYRRLVIRMLSRSLEEENSDHAATVSQLREVLYRLANIYRSQSNKAGADILEMLMATHYQNMMYAAKSLGLKDIAAKCSVTLLKYPEYVPQDKAFYQAGIACREQGNINLSFLLLNRYLLLNQFTIAAIILL